MYPPTSGPWGAVFAPPESTKWRSCLARSGPKAPSVFLRRLGRQPAPLDLLAAGMGAKGGKGGGVLSLVDTSQLWGPGRRVCPSYASAGPAQRPRFSRPPKDLGAPAHTWKPSKSLWKPLCHSDPPPSFQAPLSHPGCPSVRLRAGRGHPVSWAPGTLNPSSSTSARASIRFSFRN